MRTRFPTPVVMLSIATLSFLAVVVFRDFVRESIVVPIAYTIWITRLQLEAMPQIIPWVVLVVIVLAIARRSLSSPHTQKRESRNRIEIQRRGRVKVWANRLSRTNRGEYFKWSLAQQLAQLTLDTMAHNERVPSVEIRQRLLADRLDLPPDIELYLKVALTQPSAGRLSEFRHRLFGGTRVSVLDLDPELIIQFMEAQMGEEIDS